MRHVDELAKEILVVSQHLCVLLADAVLDLHVVQVVHVVDKAAVPSAADASASVVQMDRAAMRLA